MMFIKFITLLTFSLFSELLAFSEEYKKITPIAKQKEAFVEISTHLSYSGFPVPSIIPGISLNCLLTSYTISMAAFPTAFIAKAENTTGTIAPINSIANTGALKMLIPSIPVNVT